MRTTVGVLVAVALIVGGCSGESKPGAEGTTATITSAPTPTEPATPTPEPTPEVTMPVVEAPEPPESLTELSEEGAIASLQYFWDVYSYTNATKDFEPWEAITDPECLLCADLREDIEDHDGYVHGGKVQLEKVDVDSFVPETGFIALLIDVIESEHQVFSHDGRYIRDSEPSGDALSFEVIMLFVEGVWTVAEVV